MDQAAADRVTDVVERPDGVPVFVARVMQRAAVTGASPGELLSVAIAAIDRLIHAQVQEILHAEPFRRLEASWSSLEYLVAQKPQDDLVLLKVLNVSRDEILADLEDAIEFDRSALFLHIYEHEFGQFGGEPFGIVVIDDIYSREHEDVDILRGLAGIMAAAHAVGLAGASPDLLGLPAWSRLTVHVVPEEIGAGEGVLSWNSLRDMDDARYFGLVLPRILLRAPYRPDDPDRTSRLREESTAPEGEQLLWGNAAYALAARIMEAFHLYGWCTAIRGLTDEAGIVRGLPRISSPLDREGLVVAPPVEVAVTDAQEKAVTDLGLIPLCHVSCGPDVAFFGVPSLHRPRQVDDPAVATNLKLSAQIPYMLAASRIAHYLKVIMRDHVGRFDSREEVQRELNSWLARYTVQDDDASNETKARYPLRSYDVQIRDKPGKPGHLEAITQLQPHYQIEDPGVSLRLAVDLPDPDQTLR